MRKNIARKAGVSEDDLQAWSRAAQSQIALAGAMLANTLAYVSPPALPNIYNPPGGGGLFGLGGATVADCRCCSDEWSIFSQFAYFTDLVKLTGNTLATLDNQLKQNFSGLKSCERPLARSPGIYLHIGAVARPSGATQSR